jgi:hypothetical protein
MLTRAKEHLLLLGAPEVLRQSVHLGRLVEEYGVGAEID